MVNTPNQTIALTSELGDFELLLKEIFGRFENTFEDQMEEEQEQEMTSPHRIEYHSFLDEDLVLTPIEWSDLSSHVDKESYNVEEYNGDSDMNSVISFNSSSSTIINEGFYDNNYCTLVNDSDVSDIVFPPYSYYCDEVQVSDTPTSSIYLLLTPPITPPPSPPSPIVVQLRRSERLKQLRLQQLPLRRSARLAVLRARATVTAARNTNDNRRRRHPSKL